MAIINLDVEKILSISNELSSLDTTLLNSYVPEMKDIINQIKSNVLNEQVNSILGTISSQVDSISGEMAVDLPKLEQFLDSQMQSYQTTEADAQAKLQAVVNAMGGFAGMQSLSIDGGSAAATSVGATSSTSAGSTENNGSGLGGKVASGAVSGAVLGGVAGGFLGTAGAVGGSILLGGKIGGVVGTLGGPLGTAAGVAAGAAIGAATPAIINGVGKGLEVVGKGVTAAGSWLDSIF